MQDDMDVEMDQQPAVQVPAHNEATPGRSRQACSTPSSLDHHVP